MGKLNIGRSDVIAALALVASAASLVITYEVYREETNTDFRIRVEPLYYSEVKFRYQEEQHRPGSEAKSDEREGVIAPKHPDSHIISVPPEAVITFPVTIIVTNNSRRNVPIKNAYYFLVNKLKNTSSLMRTLHLSVNETTGTDHPRLPINIPPGESKAFRSEVSVYFDEPIAEQLRVIFEQTSGFAESKLQHPSLARLNFFAIASGDLKPKGGSAYPYLSPEFISNYTILVGMEDFTNNHRSETIHFLFPLQEFMNFVIAPPGEVRSFELSPEQREKLGLPPESKENDKSYIRRTEDMLEEIQELIALTESKGECCRH
jgi:hypothetical protein